MKLFRIELTRQKAGFILVAAFLFSLGISAFFAYQHLHSDELAMEKEGVLYNLGAAVTQKEMEVDEAKKQQKHGKADSDKVAFYEGWLSECRDLQAAYEADDPVAIRNATLKTEQRVLTEKKKYGVLRFYGSGSSAEQQARTAVKVCSILQDKDIGVYRDPNFESFGYFDGAASVSNFLRGYMFLLLPFAVTLLCFDFISGEISSGTIKLLLGAPVSRSSLFLKKYGCGILLSFFVLLAACGGAFLGGSIFCGPGDLRYPILAQSSFLRQSPSVYLPEWLTWVRAGAVYLCAILFFCAFSLLFSVLQKSNIPSLIFGLLFSVGGTVAVRQLTAAAGYQGFPLYLPFTMSDGYAAAVGSTVKQSFAFQSDFTGLLPAVSVSAQTIRNSYPGICSCLILLGWAIVLSMLAMAIFRKRDVN